MRNKDKAIRLLVCFGLCFMAAAIGTLATASNIPTWYAALQKPSFNPPNWLFGPVWTLLYSLMAVSLYRVWSSRRRTVKRPAFIAFAVQLVLNTMWSLVFFGLHSPEGGVLLIISMLIAIGVTIRFFWPLDKIAAWLLFPYLGWVSFATILNVSIALLN